MFKYTSALLILLTVFTANASNDKNPSKFNLGFTTIFNQSFNRRLINTPPKNVLGMDLFIQKYLTKRLGIQSGIIVLEKSTGKDIEVSGADTWTVYGSKYIYTGIPILAFGNMINKEKFNLKISSGIIFEKLVHQTTYYNYSQGLDFSYSYRGQADFEINLKRNYALLLNLNFTRGLRDGHLSDSATITNYGIGIGMIKRFVS